MNQAYAEGSGQSLNDARAQVLAGLPAELRIVNETIVSNGSVQTDRRRGASTDDAFAAAMRNLPDAAVVVDRKVVIEPKADAARQIEAWTSQEASTAGSKIAKELGGVLKQVETIRAPSQGFLGFGRRIGVFKAHVGYEAHIEVLYRLPCRLRVHTAPLELALDASAAAERAIELSKEALRLHTKALDSEIRVASILESGRARKPLSPNAMDFRAQYTQEYIDAENTAARDKKAAGELAETALAVLAIPGVSRALSNADLSIDSVTSGLLKFALFPESWVGKVWSNENGPSP